MLGLSVKRQDGTVLEQGSDQYVFYDEKLKIHIESKQECEVHLCVTVAGSFAERGREHSVVIFDENLDRACSWAEQVHIRHPRSPLQSPHLEIVATARYTEPESLSETGANGAKSGLDQSKYLEAFEPVALGPKSAILPFKPAVTKQASKHARGASAASGINFAEAYEERRNSKTGEMLSTRRREPQPQHQEQSDDADIRVVRWGTPLNQALELEIRSIRPALERDRVIAEIDLVAGSLPVEVSKCDVTLEDGIVDLMGDISLPLRLDAGGKFAMCFNLQVRAAPQPVHIPVSRKPLSIALDCAVLVNETAAPTITTMWTPLVDFEGTQGPLPKTPALTLPANSPMVPGHSTNIPHSASSSTLDLVASARSQASKANLGLMGGISILVTGPQFVTVGDTFEWSFKVLNRSQRTRMFALKFASGQPRDSSQRDSRLELFSVPSDAGTLIQPSSILAMPSPEQLRRRAQSHYSSIGASRGIIPLCQELRVGNLAPHTCFETSIELYAHKPGTHSIESTRIEDLSNRDSYEVGGLLEVIVEPKA